MSTNNDMRTEIPAAVMNAAREVVRKAGAVKAAISGAFGLPPETLNKIWANTLIYIVESSPNFKDTVGAAAIRAVLSERETVETPPRRYVTLQGEAGTLMGYEGDKPGGIRLLLDGQDSQTVHALASLIEIKLTDAERLRLMLERIAAYAWQEYGQDKPHDDEEVVYIDVEGALHAVSDYIDSPYGAAVFPTEEAAQKARKAVKAAGLAPERWYQWGGREEG